LPEAFVTTAKRKPGKLALADSSGRALSYRDALTASLLLARDLRKMEGEMVGLVLPASVGGALANVAATMAGKVPVNLNFTSGAEAMDSAIEQCGIRTIVTSKVFRAKARIEERAGMVYLEDLLSAKTKVAKAAAYASTYLPVAVLRRMVRQGAPEDLATVIFSSGSSGRPKGVMLSHANIQANIEASAQAFAIAPEDRIAGVLPFFHSFGFTFTLWFPLVKGLAGVYHANPLDAKAVGTVIDQYKATLLLATPTFLSNYTLVVPAEQMKSLRTVLAGAEKLRESVAEAFAEKFGVMPREGYGATEMAPVIAVNVDHVRYEGTTQHGWASGSVGRVLPGMAVRVVDPETFRAKRHGEEGLILVNGANRMMGYLHDAARTAQVLRDGWYNTGDMGKVDEKGFLYLTGRLSRFSKIAGEMVPHGKLEEAMAEILGQDGKVVVVSLPCEERGEKLAAIFQHAGWTAEGLAKALLETGLPKLWLPKRDCLVAVEEVPLLGTGKVDLRRAKELAMEALCGVSC
jgi:acyl-[acyl-carrier-protein]-phospholipid O-acyltransferase/long-chain-fatty-acid--[acyl-carrier-protein] ligase